MENTFVKNMQDLSDLHLTENLALTHSKVNSDQYQNVYQMFALGGAYRTRSDPDCILLFKKAYEENPVLALKCLFFLRDARGGEGERRFFRVCFRWLAKNYPEVALRNLENLPEYGRYDDLWYSCMDTPIERDMLGLVRKQLALDIQSKTPSLLAKWLPSENASAQSTREMGHRIRKYLGMTARQYRKTLSILRERINVLERLMSANEWDKIEFDKIPSRAGLIYKNAFACRDIIAKRYEAFAKDKNTKVNAQVLYPYEVVDKALKARNGDETDRAMVEKYWDNLPDYFHGTDNSILAVVDTSASMTWSGGATAPINVAIGLGMYCAERNKGPFTNTYISFSSYPQIISIEGVDFVDKVDRIYKTNLCQNTDLLKTFELIRNIALQSKPEDIPKTIVVISDMEIDVASGRWRKNTDASSWLVPEMEQERKQWEACGLTMPKLVYWNVQARHDNILDWGPNVSYVSGFSPVLFEQIISGVSGVELMLDKLLSPRYDAVK